MKPFAAALSLLLAVVFLIVMVAFTNTYVWADNATYWSIFAVTDILIVFGGLFLALK